MRSRNRTHPHTDDVLANTTTWLEAIRDITSLINIVPCLHAIVGAAISLLAAIEKVRGNRERCQRLADRVSTLLEDVKRSVMATPDTTDDNLTLTLNKLQSSLSKIALELENMSTRRAISRFLHRASISSQLDGCIWEVDDALQSFNRAFLIAILRRTSEQAMFDRHQLRLFRYPELKLVRARGTWQANSDVSGYEWDSEWDGRLVTVRVLRHENATEDVLKSLIAHAPLCRHPYIIQTLGRSHPDEQQKFIIREHGFIDIRQYFQSSAEPVAKLRCYFKMYVDIESTFEYLQSIKFPIAYPGDTHCHRDCLPSLSIKANGTPVLSAEDLIHATRGCLVYRLCNVLSENDHVDVTIVRAFPLDGCARRFLSILEPNPQEEMRRCATADLICHDDVSWPDAWRFKRSDRIIAGLGDFGCLHPSTNSWRPLGNVYTSLMPRHLYKWGAYMHMDGVLLEATQDYSWSAQTWTCPIRPGSTITKTIWRAVQGRVETEFFWFFACKIAQLQNINLLDLILVFEVLYIWKVDVPALDPGQGHTVSSADSIPNVSMSGLNDLPTEIYFHMLPQTANGDPPSPVGYWSLDKEPTPGPWPSLSVPGIDMHYQTEIAYYYVDDIQGELLTCFDRELNARLVVTEDDMF